MSKIRSTPWDRTGRDATCRGARSTYLGGFNVSDASSSTIDTSESIEEMEHTPETHHHHEDDMNHQNNNNSHNIFVSSAASSSSSSLLVTKQPSLQIRGTAITTSTTMDTTTSTHRNQNQDTTTTVSSWHHAASHSPPPPPSHSFVSRYHAWNSDIFRRKPNHSSSKCDGVVTFESTTATTTATTATATTDDTIVLPISSWNDHGTSNTTASCMDNDTRGRDGVKLMITTNNTPIEKRRHERRQSEIVQQKSPTISRHDQNDTEGDDDDDNDADRLNQLFNHDKDYMDLIPSSRNRTVRTNPTIIATTTDHLPSPPSTPKLRSFSEPEVRDDSMRHYSLWHSNPNHNDIEFVERQCWTTTPTNVLRHRYNHHHHHHHDYSDRRSSYDCLEPYGSHQILPSPGIGVRGRAYTADPSITSMNTTTTTTTSWMSQPRHRTWTCTPSYSATTTTKERLHHKQHDDDSSSFVPSRSFHSSWDDNDVYQSTPDEPLRISVDDDEVATLQGHPNYLQEVMSLPCTTIAPPPPPQPPQTPNDRNLLYTTSSLINAHTRRGGGGGSGSSTEIEDQERIARLRWIRINRRFQLIVAAVVLIFSMLLFAILVSWIVLASTFIMAWDKPCDVPLKPYFYLASIQLILDIFRTDILRIVFRWNQTSNASTTPGRVIAYNIVYFIYAILVLRLGIISVFTPNETPKCSTTAPELFHAGIAFVSLSLAAWVTIIFGYVLPFCVVAVLLTINGYNPHLSSNIHANSSNNAPAFQFISCGSSTSGAPPGCVDKLSTIELRNLAGTSYAKECCICMESFNDQDVIVTTKCQHIFHKKCCREWLRQARTCPVCRDDIPSSLESTATSNQPQQQEHNVNTTPEPSSNTVNQNHHVGHPLSHIPSAVREPPPSRSVTNLLRVLMDARNQFTEHRTTATVTPIHPNDIVSTSDGGTTVSVPSISSEVTSDIERGF